MLFYIFIVALLAAILLAANEIRLRVNILPLRSENAHGLNGNLYYRILAFAILFAFWFLTAFRSQYIGNDTQTYINYFTSIAENGVSLKNNTEIGFQCLCFILSLVSTDPQILIIFCATFCYLGVGVYIFRFSKNVVASAILAFCLCFSVFTNTLRQDLAMVLCLFAYHATKRGRFPVALLLILFAYTFHKTALLCLLFFGYYIYKYDVRIVAAIGFAIIILSASGFLAGIAKNLTDRYGGYFDGVYAGTGWLAVSAEVVRNFAFYIFVYRAYGKKSDKPILANFALLFLVSCFGFMVNLFTRASQYFLLAAITELPCAVYSGNGSVRVKTDLLSAGIILLLFYFMVVLIFRPEWNSLYPYSFFWN